MSIDIGMMATADSTPAPTRQWPQRTTSWLIGGLLGALVIALLVTLAALNRPVQPAAATVAPAKTHTVAIKADGDVVYYDLYGPGFDENGSTTAKLPAVPTGTRIVVIAIATKDGAQSTCGITVDGAELASMDGIGAGAVSECTATVR